MYSVNASSVCVVVILCIHILYIPTKVHKVWIKIIFFMRLCKIIDIYLTLIPKYIWTCWIFWSYHKYFIRHLAFFLKCWFYLESCKICLFFFAERVDNLEKKVEKCSGNILVNSKNIFIKKLTIWTFSPHSVFFISMTSFIMLCKMSFSSCSNWF